MNDFTELWVLLFLAHILGDFILQRRSWVEQRHTKGWRSPLLYVHGGIHIWLYLMVLLHFSMIIYWYLAVGLGVVHVIIDPIKKPAKRSSLVWFLGDQLLHLLLLTAVAFFIFAEDALGFFSTIDPVWGIITGYLFLTKPTSVLISNLLPDRRQNRNNHSDMDAIGTEKETGLINAGEYIGILERILTFTFMLQSAWIGIGFLITAKSVFRFSDLQQSKQREETEYIMIGTLMSFGIAIAWGLIFN